MLRLVGNMIAQFRARQSRKVTIGVQAVVTDRDSGVLLVRHRYREGWHFPGAGVEPNETVEQAITRELKEEVGVVLNGRPALFNIYAHFVAFPQDHIVLFVATEWTRARVPTRSFEIAEQRFFALDALPEGITAGTKRRLDEVFSGAAHVTDW